jgi:hypothetical protein
MSKDVFIEFFHGVREYDCYFRLKHDVVGTNDFWSIQICTVR